MNRDNSKQVIDLLHSPQSRREFLKLLAKGMAGSALLTGLPGCGGGGANPVPPLANIPAPSPEYTALKRTSFGVHQDELALIRSMGISAYLEQQLDPLTIDDGTLEADLQAQFPLAFQSAAQLYSGFPDNISASYRDMVAVTQYRQIFSKRQLFEVMVEFWNDHFNIHFLNGLGPTLKPVDDLAVIRTHALGNFRDLLHASARSPAMLFYLDNFFNQASAPNENYARELMELHTLGVNGGYTETDVKEVARCFTGWSIRFPNDTSGPYGEFVYIGAIHDDAAKTVLGNSIAAGGGQSDAVQVLDILADHPSTAQFIATKLCRRFISDQPQQITIDAVADAFTNSGGDIKTTLRALFDSDAFQDSSDQKFIRPAEYLAGAIRALAPATPYPTDNGFLFSVAQSIMGQLPLNWPTPDGYPDTEAYWASTGGLLNRWRLSFLSYAMVIPGLDVFQIDYGSMLGGADSSATVLDAMSESMLMRPLSNEDRTAILDWLGGLTGVASDVSLPQVSLDQLVPLVAAVLLSSAYFQLR